MAFEPMTKQDLPQTVTLFSPLKSPTTGKMIYHRTVIENVRVDEAATSMTVRISGPVKSHQTVVWIDRRTTKGYAFDDNGQRAKKSYLPGNEWLAAGDETRAGTWTLNVKHYFALPNNGQKKTIAPAFDPALGDWQAFVDRNNLQVIDDIRPTIDEDGSIHSWEVALA